MKQVTVYAFSKRILQNIYLIVRVPGFQEVLKLVTGVLYEILFYHLDAFSCYFGRPF